MAEEQPADGVLAAVGDLSAKLDTVAGALAAVASSHAELLAQVADAEARRSQDTQELAQRLDAIERQVLARASDDGPAPTAGVDPDALAALVEAVERLERRTEDRLAATRDAALAPIADLQALLQARAEHTPELTELTTMVRELSLQGPAAVREQLAELRDAVERLERPIGITERQLADLRESVEQLGTNAAADRPAPVLERLEEVGQAVNALTWQLPDLAADIVALRARGDTVSAAGSGVDPDAIVAELALHSDKALAAVLRLLDERLSALRDGLAEGPPAQEVSGFELGAVMGAAQAAWTRLEQRLDTEFDDLGRQLQAMASLIEQVSTNAEAAANRPVISGDQVKRAATSLRDSVVAANRARRDRRGGPKGLGSGPST